MCRAATIKLASRQNVVKRGEKGRGEGEGREKKKKKKKEDGLGLPPCLPNSTSAAGIFLPTRSASNEGKKTERKRGKKKKKKQHSLMCPSVKTISFCLPHRGKKKGGEEEGEEKREKEKKKREGLRG